MWGRRRRTEEDFAREVESHLHLETDKLIDEGMSPDDARTAAFRRFGNVTAHRERFYEAGRVRWLDHLWRDLRYGARMLRERPGFTAVAVLSLAIGIGANTTIFSLVNAIILHEDPFDRPDELVNVYSARPDVPFDNLSYPDFEALRDSTTHVFGGIGVAGIVFAPVDRAGRVSTISGQAVTGNYFPLLGVEASLGRVIGASDDVAPGGHPVVMLSHGYWQRAFGGDLDVVGRELRLSARAYTIIGVAPATYRGSLLAPEFYIPMTMYGVLMGVNVRENRGLHNLSGMARLAPEATLAQAKTAVAAVATSQDEARLEGWDVGGGFALVPSTEVLFDPQDDTSIRAVAWLLIVVVGLVLLMACTNLASFLLARARDRRRDVAVRLALGASRGALVRQLLTETTLLGLLGGVAGLGLAVGLLRVLQNAVAVFPLPLNLTITLDLAPDATVLAFTCGISVLTGALVGLVPALQSTCSDSRDHAQAGYRGAADSRGSCAGVTRSSSPNSRSRSFSWWARGCSCAVFSN